MSATWGSGTWGSGPWGASVEPPVVSVEDADAADGSFFKSFDFPLRFDEKGDIDRTRDEASVENNLRMSVMIRLGGIPLANHLGSLVPMLPFDPNDDATGATIVEEILRSTRIGEPRATVDAGIVTEEDENTARAIVPYIYAGRRNWESLRLSIPLQQLDNSGSRSGTSEPESY